MPWPTHGLSVSSSTVSRTSASCASLQNGSRSALSKMDAEHVAYVALRQARYVYLHYVFDLWVHRWRPGEDRSPASPADRRHLVAQNVIEVASEGSNLEAD